MDVFIGHHQLRWLGLQMLREQFIWRTGSKRRLASEAFVNHAPQAVDVSLGADILAANLLRSHIAMSSLNGRLAAKQFAERSLLLPRQIEVNQFHLIRVIDEKVVGFHVTVTRISLSRGKSFL